MRVNICPHVTVLSRYNSLEVCQKILLASNTTIEIHLSQCNGEAKTATLPWTSEAPHESFEGIGRVLSIEGIDRRIRVEFDIWWRLKISLEALDCADQLCGGPYAFFCTV